MKRWRFIPKVRYSNIKREFPILGDISYPLFSIHRFWSGRLIDISFRHHTIHFDFRHCFINDMANKEIIKGKFPR